MDMEISSMGDLARRRKTGLLLECEVEADGKLIGKVTHLLKDKYERIEGIEIALHEKHEKAHTTIPYAWIVGIDEARKVVIIHNPVKKS
jgi:hypothetical protein